MHASRRHVTGFSKIRKPTERHGAYHSSVSVSCYCFPLMRDWNWEIVQMVRKFPTFPSERKKRTTSWGSPQFPNGFSGKLLFHLTFNRNFRIFWLNGKHSCMPPEDTRRDFPKSGKPTERHGALYHLKFGFLLLFSVDERLELGNRANSKEISDVPFWTEKEDYLWR